MSLTLNNLAKLKKTKEESQKASEAPEKTEQLRPWQKMEKEDDLIDIYLKRKTEKATKNRVKLTPTEVQDDKVASQIKLRAQMMFKNIKN